MRSMFTSTFQPARRSMAHRPVLGVPRPRRAAMGVMVFAEERNALLRLLETGSKRLTDVRKWIASRIDKDPMLLKTFGQQHVSDNFWGYLELVDRDQYYADETLQALQPDLESWDLPDENVVRTEEWSAAIDILHDAMVKYGKTPLVTETGQTVPGTTAQPTAPTAAPTSGGGGNIPAGADVNSKPPSAGIPVKDVLLYGGIGAGVIALVLLLKKYA